jgi:hypothetical protein
VFLGVGGAMAGLAKDRESALITMRNKSCTPEAECRTNTDTTELTKLPKYAFDGKTRDFENQGRTFATAAQAMIPIGAVAAAAFGAFLVLDLLDASKAKKEQPAAASSSARFMGAPWAAQNGAGLVGRFEF